MAWMSMHFATGMACGAAVSCTASLILQRGWRWVPAAMTVGGVWAILPDLPRIFREDFPSLPFAAMLGSKEFERWLHSFGDLFFFHQRLDAQPHEYALHGVAAIILMYNIAIVALLWRRRRGIGHALGGVRSSKPDRFKPSAALDISSRTSS